MEERIALTAGLTFVGDPIITVYSDQTGPTGYTPALTGNYPVPGAQQGGVVATATFTVTNSTSSPIQVAFVDYTTTDYPQAGQSTTTFLNNQSYYDSATALVPAGAKNFQVTLSVNLATCGPNVEYNQCDVISGSVITNFSTSDYYGYSSTPYPNGSNYTDLDNGVVLNCVMPTTPVTGGPFTQGYYKEQHQYALPSFMAIGGQMYTRSQLVTLLQTAPKKGDATLIDVHQLITTYANLYNGSPLTTTVSNAIQQSEQQLDMLPDLIGADGNYNSAAYVSSSSAMGTILVNASSVLDTFNSSGS